LLFFFLTLSVFSFFPFIQLLLFCFFKKDKKKERELFVCVL